MITIVSYLLAAYTLHHGLSVHSRLWSPTAILVNSSKQVDGRDISSVHAPCKIYEGM